MNVLAVGLSLVLLLSATESDVVKFQAHRGGAGEYPENTMVAYRTSWQLGAVPEIDIRTTKDGEIICLHDKTLERTSNAPEDVRTIPVTKMNCEEVRKWDVGVKFDAKFTGEKVPLLKEVLAEMKGDPERQIYLDFKDVDLKQLAVLLQESGVVRQAIFCHNKLENCRSVREKAPGIRTMLWIGGKPEEIQEQYHKVAAENFQGLDQVQLHLKEKENTTPVEYLLPEAFLNHCVEETNAAGIELEVLPWVFDETSLGRLLDLGIRWYATDHPNRFAAAVQTWKNHRAQ